MILLRPAGHWPASIARISSRKISSPSPRTITSIQGASESTCLYMKVAWIPPSTRTALRDDFGGDLEDLLGLVDRWRDGGGADDIGLEFDQPGPELVVGQIIGHRVDERDVGKARVLQMAGEIGDPGRRPVAGYLGATGMIVRMNEYDAHLGLRLYVK